MNSGFFKRLWIPTFVGMTFLIFLSAPVYAGNVVYQYFQPLQQQVIQQQQEPAQQVIQQPFIPVAEPAVVEEEMVAAKQVGVEKDAGVMIGKMPGGVQMPVMDDQTLPAAVDPCKGKAKVDVDTSLEEVLARSILTKILTSYSNDTVICFNSLSEKNLLLEQTYTIEAKAGATVYIDFGGLKLKGMANAVAPLISIKGDGHVEIHHLSISGLDKSTPCLSVTSPGAIVQSSEFTGCSDGVRIETSDTLIGSSDAAHYEKEKNTIHGNSRGIHVVSGGRNKFGYNSVYDNVSGMIDIADDGILIEAGANENLVRPVMVPDEKTKSALRCETDTNGVITKREIYFTVPGVGEVEIYAVGDLQSRGRTGKQGKTFIGACSVDISGRCSLPTLLLPELGAGSKSCGVKDLYATALFTSTSSTMYLAKPFKLSDKESVITAPSGDAPIMMPGATDSAHTDSGLGSETGDVTGGVGSSGSDEVAYYDPTTTVQEEEKVGNAASAAAASDGESGGTASGMAPKVGCALVQGSPPSSGALCVIALMVVVGMLLRQRTAPKTRRTTFRRTNGQVL